MASPMQKRKLMGEINVVPYIDVMLVLLIIFMVTAPLLTQGIEVELPKANAEPIESVPDHDPVYKVTIIPRGRALGVTMFLPEEDRYSFSKRRLNSQISSLFGGRIAEELVFGADAVTTGASMRVGRIGPLVPRMR